MKRRLVFLMVVFFILSAAADIFAQCALIQWSDSDIPSGSLKGAGYSNSSSFSTSIWYELRMNINDLNYRTQRAQIQSPKQGYAQEMWTTQRKNYLTSFAGWILETEEPDLVCHVSPHSKGGYDKASSMFLYKEHIFTISTSGCLTESKGYINPCNEPGISLQEILAIHEEAAKKAKSIIDYKCGTVNQPPKITLEPATYPEFQMNILAGNGFTVKIRKEDGIWDSNGKSKLNFSTLVFATDGIDNSANFINTGADQKIFSVSSDEKEVLLKVTPDPNKFMNDQNVFNILLNGEHKIGLQICDTDGRCGKAEYTIYFGPFITVGSVSDLRCSQGKEQLSIENLIHGNMGYSSLISIYFAMINTDQPNEYWCYSSNSWNEGVLAPTFDEIIFPDAAFATVDNVPISLLSSKAIGSNLFKPFPAGKFQFLSFIVDKYSSAFRLSVIEDVKTCSLP